MATAHCGNLFITYLDTRNAFNNQNNKTFGIHLKMRMVLVAWLIAFTDMANSF